MPKGISLHIGLNAVDPAKYNGWSGPLVACEADANAMASIATSQGYSSTKVLLTKQATASAVVGAIKAAASKLNSGDTFFISYSGHGGQAPDTNGDENVDGLDETWCLYDRQMVDDELYGLWATFAKGVRILMLSDSCHSGTMARAVRDSGARIPIRAGAGELDFSAMRVRVMPENVQRGVYEVQKRAIVRAQKSNPKGTKIPVKASVVLISGCQDNQLSSDGDNFGLFTGTLLQVWNNGGFKGTLKEFHGQIVNRMPFIQTPNYFRVGTVNTKFEKAKPFTL